jgi:flavin reductase (DIM6/NTAB) family NADH-FMN oxidoreductase RutF
MTQTGFATTDRDGFLRAMRRVANSVTVVTKDGSAGCHGATVSAFSSVSADPPMVLVCLRADSRIAQAVAENGALCVNVLPHNRSDLANRFAGRDGLDDRFHGVSIRTDRSAPPEIDGATTFVGVVDQTIAAGSHCIFVCRVHSVRSSDEPPLAYLNGAYHTLVPQVAMTDIAAVS